jgi:hypothetical protein
MTRLLRRVLISTCLLAAPCAGLGDEGILGTSKESDGVVTGSYFPGDDRILKLKGDFSKWTPAKVTELWIDEYYGTAPLSRKEAACLSRYPLTERIIFGRPGPEIVHLSGPALEEFLKCPRLAGMMLNLDGFGPDLAEALGKFTKLDYLWIFVSDGGYSKPSKPIPDDGTADIILKMPKLEGLNLHGLSDFSNQFLMDLRKAPALKGLNLGSKKFDARSFEILGTMNLESLSIKVPDLKQLNLKGLEKTGIRDLGISDIGLGRSTLLQDFSLEAVDTLLKMPQLENFWSLALGENAESAEYAAARVKLRRHLEENKKRHAEAGAATPGAKPDK